MAEIHLNDHHIEPTHQEHAADKCHDPQCGDSTWDHDCPSPPRPQLTAADTKNFTETP